MSCSSGRYRPSFVAGFFGAPNIPRYFGRLSRLYLSTNLLGLLLDKGEVDDYLCNGLLDRFTVTRSLSSIDYVDLLCSTYYGGGFNVGNDTIGRLFGIKGIGYYMLDYGSIIRASLKSSSYRLNLTTFGTKLCTTT